MPVRVSGAMGGARAAAAAKRKRMIKDQSVPKDLREQAAAELINGAARNHLLRKGEIPLLSRAADEIEAKLIKQSNGFFRLYLYILFLVSFLLVLSLQRDTAQNYHMERSLLNLLKGITESEAGVDFKGVSSPGELMSWTKALVRTLYDNGVDGGAHVCHACATYQEMYQCDTCQACWDYPYAYDKKGAQAQGKDASVVAGLKEEVADQTLRVTLPPLRPECERCVVHPFDDRANCSSTNGTRTSAGRYASYMATLKAAAAAAARTTTAMPAGGGGGGGGNTTTAAAGAEGNATTTTTAGAGPGPGPGGRRRLLASSSSTASSSTASCDTVPVCARPQARKCYMEDYVAGTAASADGSLPCKGHWEAAFESWYAKHINDTKHDLSSDMDGLKHCIETGVTHGTQVPITAATAHLISGHGTYQHSSQGFLATHNRIIGGLMMVMTRRRQETCQSDPLSLKAYCFADDDANTTEICPQNHFLHECEFMARGDLTHGYAPMIMDLGVYDLGPEIAVCMLDALIATNWIDDSVRTVEFTAAVFNPTLHLFAVAEIVFAVNLGGKYDATIDVITTPARLEYQTVTDFFRAVLEGICLLCMLWVASDSIGELCRTYRALSKPRPHNAKSTKRAETKWERQLRAGLGALRFWPVMQLTMVGSFVVVAALWYQVCYYTVHVADGVQGALDISLKKDSAVLELEVEHVGHLAHVTKAYKVACAWLLLSSLLYSFRVLQFHKRISILSETVEASAKEIGHFAILFLAIIIIYAGVGTMIYGPRIHHFFTNSETFQSLLFMGFGGYSSEFPGFVDVAPGITVVFFWSFVVVVFLLLINSVFLSIVVEAYMVVKEAAASGTDIWDDMSDDLCRRSRLGCWPRAPHVSDVVAPLKIIGGGGGKKPVRNGKVRAQIDRLVKHGLDVTEARAMLRRAFADARAKAAEELQPARLDQLLAFVAKIHEDNKAIDRALGTYVVNRDGVGSISIPSRKVKGRAESSGRPVRVVDPDPSSKNKRTQAVLVGDDSKEADLTPEAQALRSAFAETDINGNGTIDIDELKSLLTRTPCAPPDVNAQALMAKYSSAAARDVLTFKEFALVYGELQAYAEAVFRGETTG